LIPEDASVDQLLGCLEEPAAQILRPTRTSLEIFHNRKEALPSHSQAQIFSFLGKKSNSENYSRLKFDLQNPHILRF